MFASTKAHISKKPLLKQIFFLAFVWLFSSFISVSAFAITQEDYKKSTELNESAIRKLKAGNLDGAEMDLLQALVYSGQNPKIRKNLGAVYYERGVYEEKSRKNFQQSQRYHSMALDIEPSNPKYQKAYAASLFLEANARVREGRSDEALRLYEKAANLDPTNITAWVQASQYAWSSQKLELARQFLEKAKVINPQDKNVQILEQRLSKTNLEADHSTEHSEHFILSADPSYLKNVGSHQILFRLEEAFSRVALKLSYYPKNKIPVVFYPVNEFRNHWKLPSRVNAFYDGKLRIPYYDEKTPVETLRFVLMHELTHAFVSTLTSKPIPQWLNEGLAQWVEDRSIEVKAKDALMIYQTTRRMPDLQHLDSIFGAQGNSFNNTEMTLAYMKSLSVVQYLIEQHGIWTLMQMLSKFHQYATPEEAFKKHFGQNLSQIEKDWLNWFSNR